MSVLSNNNDCGKLHIILSYDEKWYEPSLELTTFIFL